MVMATITVNDEVKQELKKIGRKGESCNDIIKRLLIFYRNRETDAELNNILENEEFTPLDLEAI